MCIDCRRIAGLPMLLAEPEPLNDELFETLIFDLNIVKLPAMVPTSSPTERPAVADLTVLTTSINNSLKLMLDDIWSLASVPIQESTPIQPINMETEADTTTSNHILTHIPEKTTSDNVTAVDVALHAPALNPSIYLTMPMVLPSPPMIATVAAATYIPLLNFHNKSFQILSETPWLLLSRCTVSRHCCPVCCSPEHHWPDYRLALQYRIKLNLLPPTTSAPAASQQMPSVPKVPIVTQSAPQPMVMQLRLMGKKLMNG
uniref:Uncharacterized protein n=1 Tax=Romanomermis culicivorax TaxID=13658 RepID=A0A915L644_ROMCU